MLSLYFTMIFYIILHMIISLFSTVETSPENIQEQRSTFDVLLRLPYTINHSWRLGLTIGNRITDNCLNILTIQNLTTVLETQEKTDAK